MKPVEEQSTRRGLASLRNLVRNSAPASSTWVEKCDLCAAGLAERHQHLIDPQTRRLLCACDACSILFSSHGETKYRRVPRDTRHLVDFRLSDQSWNSLAIPIGLAFIMGTSEPDRVIALYPSPAGPTEAAVDTESWQEIVAENAGLRDLMPDVEALLINRMNGAREYFRAPVDECYKLTGIVRKYWRGFHWGEEGWTQIAAFFDDLKRRSYPELAKPYAGSIV